MTSQVKVGCAKLSSGAQARESFVRACRARVPVPRFQPQLHASFSTQTNSLSQISSIKSSQSKLSRWVPLPHLHARTAQHLKVLLEVHLNWIHLCRMQNCIKRTDNAGAVVLLVGFGMAPGLAQFSLEMHQSSRSCNRRGRKKSASRACN